MQSFIFALQFLTTIPFKFTQKKEVVLPGLTIYFPLVGLLLGIALALSAKLFLALNFGDFAINTLSVVLLIILTGALHLDGLSDTADAILSRKSRDSMLVIMRDPHVGVMGAVSIFSVLLIKVGLLSSLGFALKTPVLILMCVLSRWSMAWTISLFPYARSEGKARIFAQGVDRRATIIAAVISLIISITLFKAAGFVVFCVSSLCAYLIGGYINKKIGGITGDSLGAINELSEVIVLLSVCFIGSVVQY